jgi:hypothetical protein
MAHQWCSEKCAGAAPFDHDVAEARCDVVDDAIAEALVPIRSAPLLGEHNRDVDVDMLGIPEAELDELRTSGAI